MVKKVQHRLSEFLAQSKKLKQPLRGRLKVNSGKYLVFRQILQFYSFVLKIWKDKAMPKV